MGKPLGCLLVAILSVKFLLWSVSALTQCSSAICIYSHDPITFISNYSINCAGWMGVIALLFSKFHKLLYVTCLNHSNAYLITQYIHMGHMMPLSTSSG